MKIDEYVQSFSVVWEKCLTLKKCIDVFGQEFCIRVRACLRVVLENGTYYVEADVAGKKFRWKIVDKCYTVYSIGIGSIKICIDKISKGVRIEAKACLDVWPVDDCWTIYGVNVKFLRFAEIKNRAGLLALGLSQLQLEQMDDDSHLVVASEYDVSGVVDCNCD